MIHPVHRGCRGRPLCGPPSVCMTGRQRVLALKRWCIGPADTVASMAGGLQFRSSAGEWVTPERSGIAGSSCRARGGNRRQPGGGLRMCRGGGPAASESLGMSQSVVRSRSRMRLTTTASCAGAAHRADEAREVCAAAHRQASSETVRALSAPKEPRKSRARSGILIRLKPTTPVADLLGPRQSLSPIVRDRVHGTCEPAFRVAAQRGACGPHRIRRGRDRADPSAQRPLRRR
jgi:hypothetical protein